jgi:hypothetical protein
MEQEYDEANRQLEHELWETLDRCAEKGADPDDLRFLAWQCGCFYLETKLMSRSNPTDGARNPASRWFEFASGVDGGFVRYYDKEAEKQVALGDANTGGTFTLILLDELATVKGWHDASESGIFANEVRDTRQDILVVKSFKGGELASGLYADIKDRIVAVGGHFVSSCYIAYKDETRRCASAISASRAPACPPGWTSRKSAPTRKTPAGRTSRRTTWTPSRSLVSSSKRKAAPLSACRSFCSLRCRKKRTSRPSLWTAELQAFLRNISSGLVSKPPRLQRSPMHRRKATAAPRPMQRRTLTLTT